MRIIKFSVGSLKWHFQNQWLNSFFQSETCTSQPPSQLLWKQSHSPIVRVPPQNHLEYFLSLVFLCHRRAWGTMYFWQYHPIFSFKIPQMALASFLFFRCFFCVCSVNIFYHNFTSHPLILAMKRHMIRERYVNYLSNLSKWETAR